MSYLSQMAGLAVQNFVSAAVGMAVLVAVIRGFTRRSANDARQLLAGPLPLARRTSSLPLSIVLAVVLISQGVPQTFDGAATATTLEGAEQTIARGPVASQIAIKQLGTNGGGFYNSNSAVPFENPNGLTNFLEMLSILLIPAGLVFMFGKMVGARKQGYAVFAAMFAMFVDRRGGARARSSSRARRCCSASGVDTRGRRRPERREHGRQGGALRDRQHRPLGRRRRRTPRTARSTAATTRSPPAAEPCRSSNMFTGEVIFGGVGSGLYGMVFYIVIAVFVAGLMVGRTPEYLGKKIEAREIKLAAVGALFVPTHGARSWSPSRSSPTSASPRSSTPAPTASPRRFYAYDSQGNNNGSAFAGYGATDFSTPPRHRRPLSRPLRPADRRARARGLARPEEDRPGLGRDVPHRRRRRSRCCSSAVIVLTAGLMIFPALALGPIVEALS